MTVAYAEKVVEAAGQLTAWNDLPFFANEFSDVAVALSEDGAAILPKPDAVFAALEGLGPDDVRVVILGQDPYPTAGHGHGLAFSVQEDVRPLPRSLSNIFKEMESDLSKTPSHGFLGHWASQGVLLLNSALTVSEGDAGSHSKIGWTTLTTQVVERLASRDGLVWILWGKHAQAFRSLIDAGPGGDALVIESAHPSPLSARRGFFGSKPFSRTNNHLKSHGLAPIDWMP